MSKGNSVPNTTANTSVTLIGIILLLHHWHWHYCCLVPCFREHHALTRMQATDKSKCRENNAYFLCCLYKARCIVVSRLCVRCSVPKLLMLPSHNSPCDALMIPLMSRSGQAQARHFNIELSKVSWNVCGQGTHFMCFVVFFIAGNFYRSFSLTQVLHTWWIFQGWQTMTFSFAQLPHICAFWLDFCCFFSHVLMLCTFYTINRDFDWDWLFYKRTETHRYLNIF